MAEEIKLEPNKAVKTNDVAGENAGAEAVDSLLSQIGKANTEEKKEIIEKVDKMKKLVMVIRKNLLLGEEPFQGFKSAEATDYISRILEHYEYMERGLAEENPEYKQPIGYGIIINPDRKQVFTYKRAEKDGEYDEDRLKGKYSWGVGVHIDKTDGENPINTSLLREIEEEIGLQKSQIKNLKVLGYINDEEDEVGKVHFGVLYLAETDAEIIQPKGEMASGKLTHYTELKQLIEHPEVIVENWSKISLDPLHQHFANMDTDKAFLE